MADAFQQYSSYYDLLYRDKDYAAEADYVAAVLKKAVPDAKHLLEFGSGTGRHGRLLGERGYNVFGVEYSESMVAAANSGSFDACQNRFACIQGDIRMVKLDRDFDAVISLFHVVSYQTTNFEVLQAFANANLHLRSGGVFLFDVWHGPAVLSQRPAVRVKRIENDKIRVTRIAEPEINTNSSVVTVRYTIIAENKGDGHVTIFAEEHCMRYLFPIEMDLLCRKTGFQIEKSEEFLTGNTPSESSWGVAYLLRKTSHVTGSSADL